MKSTVLCHPIDLFDSIEESNKEYMKEFVQQLLDEDDKNIAAFWAAVRQVVSLGLWK